MQPTTPPSIPPPPDGNRDRGPALNAVIWVMVSLSTLFCLARVYSRSRITRNFDWADGVITLTIILMWGESAFISTAIHYGLGRHVYYLQPDQIMNMSKWQIISSPIGILAPCLSKIAVTAIIVQIFAQPKRYLAIALWTLNATTIMISMASVVISFAQCRPVSAQWRGESKCWDSRIPINVSLAQGSMGALIDFVLALIPIFFIWNLQINRKKKAGICVLMGLGIIAGVAAIMKTIKLNLNDTKGDATWVLWSLALWLILEMNIVFICACIPVSRPLWIRVVSPKGRRSLSGVTAGTYPSAYPLSSQDDISRHSENYAGGTGGLYSTKDRTVSV